MPCGIINTTYSFFTILTVKNVTLEGNVNKQIRFLRLQEVVTLAQGIVSWAQIRLLHIRSSASSYNLRLLPPSRLLLRAQQSLTSRLCLSQIITCDKQNNTERLVNESGNPLGLSRSRLCFAESRNNRVWRCENNERRIVFWVYFFWNYSNLETFLNPYYILCSTILLN